MMSCYCTATINSTGYSSHNIGYLVNSTVILINSIFVCKVNTSINYAIGHLVLANYSTIILDNLSNNGTVNAT